LARIAKPGCYIAGEWVAARHHEPVVDPYTGETVGMMPIADDTLIERALDSAHRAAKPFASLARDQRADILHKIEQGIGKQAEEFAQLIRQEGGKPIKLARAEVERSILTCRLAAEEATRFGGEWLPLDISPGSRGFTALVGRVPLGPTLAITPFNFPLNLVMHKLAPAIAVGCPTIIKPASFTPLTALKLAKVCHEAGCPPGSVQVAPCRGSMFEKAVRDERPKMLSFTGSAEVGWGLREIAGRKRVALELGGNAAAVVHEDADLGFAAKRIAFGGFAHAGQVCISAQRVFIHKPVYPAFLPMLLKECRSVKCGDPSDEEVIAGPMISTSEADRIESWVGEATKSGAKALLKGKREGNVLKPVVLENVPHDAKAWAKEIFGPVITVEAYSSWDEALAMVNESIYGLQAGIFTRDVGRIAQAYSELEVGAVIAGDIPTVRVDNYPYGGVKESGTGREGVRCTMVEMTEERVLVVKMGR
jgi:acyl-CoA reductase-like NAD-dependent aldehyde dehydrogenase